MDRTAATDQLFRCDRCNHSCCDHGDHHSGPCEWSNCDCPALVKLLRRCETCGEEERDGAIIHKPDCAPSAALYREGLPPFDPQPGEEVAVRDARGFWLRKIVVHVGTGHNFPCHDVAWDDEREEVWTPWPAEDVRPLSEHPDALTREEFKRVP